MNKQNITTSRPGEAPLPLSPTEADLPAKTDDTANAQRRADISDLFPRRIICLSKRPGRLDWPGQTEVR